MIEELTDVLNRPRIKVKFEITVEDILGLLILLEERAENVPVSGDINVCRDKDDDLVIETAIKGQVKYLVTRDDDIKFDKEVSSFLLKHDVTVISLSKFLAVINKG